jgi:hypothetical protein
MSFIGKNQFTSVFTTENTTNMPSKGNSPFKPMKDIKISEKGSKLQGR